MITIYELLEVAEDASKEEIEKAYSKLILEFRQDPNFDAKTNKENEMVLNRLKLAYQILTDDEKRAKYDNDLAKKRAESLIAGVVTQEDTNNIDISQKENVPKENNQNLGENINQQQSENYYQNSTQKQPISEVAENIKHANNKNKLSQKEKNDIRNAAKKEFKENLKKLKQVEAEYNEAYNKAYNDYLRKNGYRVEEPWTLKRIGKVVISILVIILVCIIMWCIPPIRNLLIDTYNSNFIIKSIVDLVKIIFGAIIGIFK